MKAVTAVSNAFVLKWRPAFLVLIALGSLTLLLLERVVPVFADFYSGGSHFPWILLRVFDISEFVCVHFTGVTTGLMLLTACLWIQTPRLIEKYGECRVSIAFSKCVIASATLLSVCILALAWPVIRLRDLLYSQ